MRVELPSGPASNIVFVHATRKLSKQDYEDLVPVVTKMIAEKGTIRVLFDMDDFHGWTPGGLWEDIKFDFKHFSDIERVAIVGEAKWQEAMAAFCRPFTTATIRYFERGQLEKARRWIAESN